MDALSFVGRRLLRYLTLCLVATFVAYALASMSFDPLARLQQRSPPPPQSVVDARRAELRLDEPIPVRFAHWLADAVRGDLGRTVVGTPVTAELGRRVGVTLRLVLLGTTLGLLAGVALGVAGAVRRYSFGDRVVTLLSLAILSTPVVVLGLLLKHGALEINHLAGRPLLAFTGETSPVPRDGPAALADRLRHLALPTLTIALIQIAYTSRYQRSAMLDVLGSEFLRTARAKGLTRRRAMLRHGLRTALVPMAPLLVFSLGVAVTGAPFTERIFGWFGMGDWLIVGVEQGDANITVTVALFMAVCMLVAGLLSDVLLMLVDPRIRRPHTGGHGA